MRLMVLTGLLILSGYVPPKPKETLQIVCIDGVCQTYKVFSAE